MELRKQKYILEKRHADGSLDLTEPQPPFMVGTLNQIADHYYAQVPGEGTVDWDTIKAWYAAWGWTWRTKTW